MTIHMPYIDEENFDAMSVKHFSSEDNGSLVDPGGKFLEALQKFVIFDHDNPNIFDDTDGKEELHKLFKKQAIFRIRNCQENSHKTSHRNIMQLYFKGIIICLYVALIVLMIQR